MSNFITKCVITKAIVFIIQVLQLINFNIGKGGYSAVYAALKVDKQLHTNTPDYVVKVNTCEN